MGIIRLLHIVRKSSSTRYQIQRTTTNMKNFACLILGMGLLVSATMANPIENDTVDRVKRGSLNFKVLSENISAAKKNFIVAQIKKLNRGVTDASSNGKLAGTLRDAVKKQFGGKWLVIGCEKDEFCSIAQTDLNYSEYLAGTYGQAFWSVFKV